LCAKPKLHCIIDSGAFSAFNSGKKIILEEYCDWLLANPWCDTYVALDVIIPDNPEEAAQKSFENLRYMHSRGLKPIPVFHVKERDYWLHKMLDFGCDYVGLSATSIVKKSAVDEWYSNIWRLLVNDAGLPTVKVHAFGESRLDIMTEFPWFSVDSTSWLWKSAMSATLMLPNNTKVSMRHDLASSQSMKHIEILDEHEFATLELQLNSIGLPMSCLESTDTATQGTLRAYASALSYIDIGNKSNRKLPKRLLSRTLFSSAGRDAPAIDMPTGTRFYLALGGPPISPAVIAVCDHPYILVSYHTMMTSKVHARLDEFVLDPKRICSEPGPSRKYFNILQEILN